MIKKIENLIDKHLEKWYSYYRNKEEEW
jgi:hypothetical protein